MTEMEAKLSFGLMLTRLVDELQDVAMSLGRVLADTALALWDVKVHKGKGVEKKIEVHATLLTAAVMLRRAREKAARNKKQKTEHEEKAKELALAAAGKHSADMKQKHHMAVWMSIVPQNMTLNEFAKSIMK